MIFNDYARYYNLIYEDKDYLAETEYIIELLKLHGKDVNTILDLGCGTGQHALQLAQRGYRVTGIDRSEEMLCIAQKTIEPVHGKNDALSFFRSDIRDLRLGKTFDAAVSLFHVISYQPTNSDLINAITTARVHLQKGGVFIFDFWYGPGVLSELPKTRVRRYREEDIEVTRISEPVLFHNNNLVEVHYHLLVKERDGQVIDEIEEMHRMRYLFAPELELILEQVGFKVLGLYGYMTTDEPRLDSWNACMVVESN